MSLTPKGHIVAERIAVLANGWLIAEVRWDGGPKGGRRTAILLPPGTSHWSSPKCRQTASA